MMSDNTSFEKQPSRATDQIGLPDISSMKIEDPLEFSDEYKRLYTEYMAPSKPAKEKKPSSYIKELQTAH